MSCDASPRPAAGRVRRVLAACAVAVCGLGAFAAGATSEPSWVAPVSTGAQDWVTLHAGFSPMKLGASTTIGFGFRIHSPKGKTPQPVIGIDLRLPKGLGAGTTSLGLATCTEHTINVYGPPGCPRNSLIGRGSAIAVVPINPEVISEKVKVVLLAANSPGPHLRILYSAEGYTPVQALLVFHGEIFEGATPPYGDEIETYIPPIPTLPEAPYAAVTTMQATIGPKHLTYYKRVHGKRVAFHPEGLELPRACPKGGFKFAATFTFLDGASKTATRIVPCPRTRRRG